MDKPKLNITYIQFFEAFYVQAEAFAKFLNDTDGKVEDWKYFDSLLYVLRSRFDSEAKEKGWEYKIKSQEVQKNNQ